MDATIKDKWIAALTSGEYRQTRNSLQFGGGYCCLGVLCDLAAKEGKGKWGTDAGGCVFTDSKGLDEFDVPSTDTLEWAGLVGSDWNHLAELNDDGHTFDTIAEVIKTDF